MLFVSNKAAGSPTSLRGTSQLSRIVHPRAHVQWIPQTTWKLATKNRGSRWQTQAICPKTWSWNISRYSRSDWGIFHLDQNHQLKNLFMPAAYSLSVFWLVHDLFPTAMPKHGIFQRSKPSVGATSCCVQMLPDQLVVGEWWRLCWQGRRP